MIRPHSEQDVPIGAFDDTFDQATEARDGLLLGADAFLRLPLLDALVGGLPAGAVWFVAAFSGNGKTSLLLSLTLALLRQRHTVYYLGLETRPNELRTQLACLRLGHDAGDVLTGHSRAWASWPSVRSELIADIEQQRSLREGYRMLVNGRRVIDLAGVHDAFQDAASLGADLVIVDHIDHMQTGAGDYYAQSRQVVDAVLRLAQDTGLRVLAATQLNNEAVRGDRLAAYRPPQPQHVYMGAHKRMVASGMLGLYRPLRSDVTREELRAVHDGDAEPRTVLEPDAMGVVCMKHRYYGRREGARLKLRIERSLVSEIPERDRYTTSVTDGGPRP